MGISWVRMNGAMVQDGGGLHRSGVALAGRMPEQEMETGRLGVGGGWSVEVRKPKSKTPFLSARLQNKKRSGQGKVNYEFSENENRSAPTILSHKKSNSHLPYSWNPIDKLGIELPT